MKQDAEKCNVCECDFEIESEGGISGFFGILPVSFCPTCISSMCDMVDQLNDKSEWIELTDEEINNAIKEKNIAPLFTYRMIARTIEAKLKEKNNG
jgi:hypothetical protein